MEVCGSDYYVYSPDYGLWEPLVDLGDKARFWVGIRHDIAP